MVNISKVSLNAISQAAVNIAEQIKAHNIIAETKSGATAAMIAACRPHMPIIAVTSEPRTAQQLALSYATRCFVRPDGEKAGVELARELFDSGYFEGLEKMQTVIVSGRQPGVIGEIDTIRIRVIE